MLYVFTRKTFPNWLNRMNFDNSPHSSQTLKHCVITYHKWQHTTTTVSRPRSSPQQSYLYTVSVPSYIHTHTFSLSYLRLYILCWSEHSRRKLSYLQHRIYTSKDKTLEFSSTVLSLHCLRSSIRHVTSQPHCNVFTYCLNQWCHSSKVQKLMYNMNISRASNFRDLSKIHWNFWNGPSHTHTHTFNGPLSRTTL